MADRRPSCLWLLGLGRLVEMGHDRSALGADLRLCIVNLIALGALEDRKVHGLGQRPPGCKFTGGKEPLRYELPHQLQDPPRRKPVFLHKPDVVNAGTDVFQYLPSSNSLARHLTPHYSVPVNPFYCKIQASKKAKEIRLTQLPLLAAAYHCIAISD